MRQLLEDEAVMTEPSDATAADRDLEAVPEVIEDVDVAGDAVGDKTAESVDGTFRGRVGPVLVPEVTEDANERPPGEQDGV
jgi:hypothetical protein